MLHPILAVKTPAIFGTSVLTGDVGLELEIEGDNLPRQVTNWLVKPEGSLRGLNGRHIEGGENQPDTPQEYISRGPVLIEDLPARLQLLCQQLTTNGSSVRLTPRASTHIHLNMTQDTLQTMLLYVLLFSMYEPTLLRMCGPQRNGNLFCLPAYETGELPLWITRVYRACSPYPSMDYVRHSWPKRGKYATLNTDPLMSFGSVETRCFPNSVDPDEIVRWATYLVKMRQMARDLTFDTMLPFIDRAYAEPMWFLSQVFSLGNIYSVCAPTHPAELVFYGVEQGYEVWKALSEFNEYSEKKVKPKKKSAFNLDNADVLKPTWAAIGSAEQEFSEPPELFDDEDAP